MVAYRLRIELPDRPGALAAITGEIGTSDANIVSIDVHEVDGTTVIDEIVVDVPETWAPAPLAAALAANTDGLLLSSRRITNRADPITGALDAVAAMVGSPTSVDTACCQALLGLAHGSSARILDLEAAAADPVASVALERRTTVVTRPDSRGAGWVLAAVDDTVEPETIALVTRSLNVRFSATEVGRAEALLRIRRQLRKTATAPA